MRDACKVKDALGVVEHMQTAEAVNQTQQGIKTRKAESHLVCPQCELFSTQLHTSERQLLALHKKKKKL